jgi:hypothetical protein
MVRWLLKRRPKFIAPIARRMMLSRVHPRFVRARLVWSVCIIKVRRAT